MTPRFEQVDFTTLSPGQEIRVMPAKVAAQQSGMPWLSITLMVVATGIIIAQQYQIHQLKQQQYEGKRPPRPRPPYQARTQD